MTSGTVEQWSATPALAGHPPGLRNCRWFALSVEVACRKDGLDALVLRTKPPLFKFSLPIPVGWHIGPYQWVHRHAHEHPQLLNHVSCVYVQARRKDRGDRVAYTLSFFEIRGGHREIRICGRRAARQLRHTAKSIVCVIAEVFSTVKFEKSVQLVVCVWQHAKGSTQCPNGK